MQIILVRPSWLQTWRATWSKLWGFTEQEVWNLLQPCDSCLPEGVHGRVHGVGGVGGVRGAVGVGCDPLFRTEELGALRSGGGGGGGCVCELPWTERWAGSGGRERRKREREIEREWEGDGGRRWRAGDDEMESEMEVKMTTQVQSYHFYNISNHKDSYCGLKLKVKGGARQRINFMWLYFYLCGDKSDF